MGLQGIVAAGIATAKTVTADLQPNVTHAAWTGQSSQGRPTFATGVSIPALVEGSSMAIRQRDGEDAVAHSKLTILQTITANGASNRREPNDPRDKFTLPDGTVARVLKVEGLERKSTTGAFLHEIWLG